MSLEHFIITVYCWMNDRLEILIQGQALRQREFEPGLSDAKAITMEVIGEFLGIDSRI